MVLRRGETEGEAGFRAHFAEAGVPIDITARSLDRDVGKRPSVIAEIRRAGPDLVHAWGTSVTLGIAGRDPGPVKGPDDHPPMIRDRPVPCAMVTQPARPRIVKAFGPAGRNVTGVSRIVPVEPQVKAMAACMPVDRIAVIRTPTEPDSVPAAEQRVSLGRHPAIRIEAFPVPPDLKGNPDRDALPGLIDEAADEGARSFSAWDLTASSGSTRSISPVWRTRGGSRPSPRPGGCLPRRMRHTRRWRPAGRTGASRPGRRSGCPAARRPRRTFPSR